MAMATLAVLDAAANRVVEARAGFDAVGCARFDDTSVPALLWIMSGHLDLALARAAWAAGEARVAQEHENSARCRARCAPGTRPFDRDEHAMTPAWLGLNAQLARLNLECALARHVTHPARREAAACEKDAGASTADMLVVSLDERWFEPPRGERVSLADKPLLARVLRGLVQQRMLAPGVPLSIDELQKIGWPGEKMSSGSAAKRIYTTIWRLRQLGIVGLREEEGKYLLASNVALRVFDAQR